jgi:hypothetical protein
MPFNSAEDADEFCKQITQAGLRWGRPIWWYDWQKPFEKLKITGASCFVLRFKTGFIGVTAAHVENQLLKTRRYTASLDRRLQLTPFNLLYAVIETNDDLDIATFRISEGAKLRCPSIRCLGSMASRDTDRAAGANPTGRLSRMPAGN